MVLSSYQIMRFLEEFPEPLSALMLDSMVIQNGWSLGFGNLGAQLTLQKWKHVAEMECFWTYETVIDKRTDPETRRYYELRVLVEQRILCGTINVKALVPAVVVGGDATGDLMLREYRENAALWRHNPPWRAKRYTLGTTVRVPRGRLFREKWQCEAELALGSLAGDDPYNE